MYRRYPYTNFHDINLDFILNRIKDLETKIREIENFKEGWDEKLEALDRQYEELLDLYYNMMIDNANFKTNIIKQFETLATSLEASINSLEAELESTINQYIIESNRRLNGFENQLTAMNRRLDEALSNLWMNMKMINPFTGQEEGVLNVIDYLASLHMQDGITAGDYDSLELTAQVYDDKELTAREYDTQANILLRQ